MSRKLSLTLISSLLLVGCYPTPCAPYGDITNPWQNYCPPESTYPIYTYTLDVARHSLTAWSANFAGPTCVVYTPVGYLQNLGGICPARAAVPCDGMCDIYGQCSISCYAPLYF